MTDLQKMLALNVAMFALTAFTIYRWWRAERLLRLQRLRADLYFDALRTEHEMRNVRFLGRVSVESPEQWN